MGGFAPAITADTLVADAEVGAIKLTSKAKGATARATRTRWRLPAPAASSDLRTSVVIPRTALPSCRTWFTFPAVRRRGNRGGSYPFPNRANPIAPAGGPGPRQRAALHPDHLEDRVPASDWGLQPWPPGIRRRTAVNPLIRLDPRAQREQRRGTIGMCLSPRRHWGVITPRNGPTSVSRRPSPSPPPSEEGPQETPAGGCALGGWSGAAQESHRTGLLAMSQLSGAAYELSEAPRSIGTLATFNVS